MKVTLTPYTRRHFTCKVATSLSPAQTSDLHELGHCESKTMKKTATSPFDIHVASSSVIFMIHAANWHETYVHTHTHGRTYMCCYIPRLEGRDRRSLSCTYHRPNLTMCVSLATRPTSWVRYMYWLTLSYGNTAAWMASSTHIMLLNTCHVSVYVIVTQWKGWLQALHCSLEGHKWILLSAREPSHITCTVHTDILT